MTLKRTFASLIFGVIAIISSSCYVEHKPSNRKLTPDAIRSIKIGMTLKEVQAILGRPLKITSFAGAVHQNTCERPIKSLDEKISSNSDIRGIVNAKFSSTEFCCEAYKRTLKDIRVTLVYTESQRDLNYSWLQRYPMLWVHLNDDFSVRSIYVKEYAGIKGLNETVIYCLSEDLFGEKKELLEKNFN